MRVWQLPVTSRRRARSNNNSMAGRQESLPETVHNHSGSQENEEEKEKENQKQK